MTFEEFKANCLAQCEIQISKDKSKSPENPHYNIRLHLVKDVLAVLEKYHLEIVMPSMETKRP